MKRSHKRLPVALPLNGATQRCLIVALQLVIKKNTSTGNPWQHRCVASTSTVERWGNLFVNFFLHLLVNVINWKAVTNFKKM